MVYWKQLKSLLVHKWHVFLAGRVLGVPLWRLIIHDWSKFSPSEFGPYSRWKFGDATNREWARGWLHHLHCSPHHPEHWVLSWHGTPEFYSEIGKDIALFVNILPMPETYVREMLADMMSTSKQQAGSYDIANWLNKNGPNMHLHDQTITLINKVMQEIGYYSTDNHRDWSWVAGVNTGRTWRGTLRYE